MELKKKLQEDLKAAMLARESDRVEVLKGLKSAILYAEVAAKKREEGLSDPEVLSVLKKESKKRQDAIELYNKGGNTEMADKEAAEKEIIDTYLPEQLSEEATSALVDEAIANLGIETPSNQDMGKIIGAVKSKNTEVDGATLARIVKERIV